MKKSLPLVVGLLLGGHALTTDYGHERTLKTTSELELDLETTAMEMKIDGQPPPDGQGAPRGGGSSSLVRSCVLVDHVLEGSGATPGHVKRTFETLHDKSAFSFGENERSDEHDYPLQGVTLELTREDDGSARAEVVEGQKPEDPALLEGQELTLFADAFLPEGAVDVGQAWELDDAQLKRALGTALDAKLFAEPAPDENRTPRGEGGDRGGRRGGGRGRGGAARSLGFVTWKGKAKLVETDAEHDGLVCARIELHLEGEGDLPEPSFRGGGRSFLFDPSSTAPVAGTVAAKLDGELFVSLEKKRPVALKLDGTLRTENSWEGEREGHTMSSHSTQEGRLTLTLRVEE